MNEKPIELGAIIKRFSIEGKISTHSHKNPNYLIVKIIEESPDQETIESCLNLVGIPPESCMGPFPYNNDYLLVDQSKFEEGKVKEEIERLSQGY